MGQTSEKLARGLSYVHPAGRKVRYDIMKGHNHISPNCALMTGEGEEWAESVAVWAKEKISQ